MEKINIAELLKDCPKGMDLDCTMIDNVVFEKIEAFSSHRPIIIRRTDSNTTIHLTKYGQYSEEEDYKCVIFPKGKTTWEGFVPPIKFKVGDKIKHKDSGIYCTLGEYSEGISAYRTDIVGLSITYKDMEQWELIPNKFDVFTLKPFDKVLVRDNNTQKWTTDLFSFYDRSPVYPYSCIGHYTNQCIPYEGNQHLLGTTDDCDEYYKNWE